MKMRMKMINENDNKYYSNWGYQDSFYFFFHERYFKCKKHKQKHLSNVQPDISKQTKRHLSNIQPDISKQKKHLSNIQPNISKQKKTTPK